jgi:diguanylate cyclase (GGDEF)-like protein/PAS domain S-box-containing protein
MSFVSKGIEALTGYRQEALEQELSWADLICPEDLTAVEEAVRTGIDNRTVFNLDYRIFHRSGEIRWVHERGHVICAADGEPLFLEGIISDATEQRQLELSLAAAVEAQQASARRWKTVLDAIPQMVWTSGPDGAEFYNGRWVDFIGRHGLDLERSELLHPDDRERVLATWANARQTGSRYECEYRLRHHSGDFRWVISRGHPARDEHGRIEWFGTCTDVHERVLAQQALHESEALCRGIIEASPDCIKILDLEGVIQFVNDAGCKAMELVDKSQMLGQHWPSLLPPDARPAAVTAISAAMQGALGHLTACVPTMTGTPKWWDIVTSPIPGEKGAPAKLLVISRDVTHQKVAEEQVAWSANHDSLTGLANRALFQTQVEQVLARCEATDGEFALLLLDVDNFKRVNDTLGHDAGDKLLCTFAERLTAAARGDDVVARLGGDEFAVLLTGVGSPEGVAAAVDGLLERLREPCIYAGRMLDCHASIGASIYPMHGADRATLLKSADIALYAAKAAGRSNLKLFEPRMRREMQLRSSMLNLARDALSKKRIVPFYQPKVELRTGKTAGFEALLRWNHPARGVQMPATIAAAFEDTNLAAEISDQMIDQVIEDARRWLDDGVRFGHVAINAAAAEFRRGSFAEQLLERLDRARIPTSYIQLEVTETVFLGRGAEYVERALKTLSKAGVKIALDDFGTGYASLSHLKQFPVDLLKIDRSFVRDFDLFPDDGAIIRAVVSLGQSLGIKVIAEGIETEAHHRFLVGSGCEFGQGFLYAKAVPAAEVPGLLRTKKYPCLVA